MLCLCIYMCDCWVIVQNMSHSHEKIKGYYEKTWIPWMSSLSLAVLCQITFTVQFSRSVVSNSLRPHEPQQARLPCPSATPGVHQNPCQLSRWCHPTISSSVVPFFSCLPSIFWPSGSFPVSPSQQVAKVLEFQLQHQSFYEHPGLISFRMDWLDLLAVQGTLKSLLQHHSSKSINSLALSFLYSPAVTSIYDTGKTIALTR